MLRRWRQWKWINSRLVSLLLASFQQREGGRQTDSLKGQILAILLLRRGERLHLVLLSLRQLHIISIISNSFYSPLLCILHLVRWPRNPTYSDQQWRDVLQDRVATLFGKVQQSQRAHTITENTKTLHPSSPSLCLIAETSWLLIVSTLTKSFWK